MDTQQWLESLTTEGIGRGYCVAMNEFNNPETVGPYLGDPEDLVVFLQLITFQLQMEYSKTFSKFVGPFLGAIYPEKTEDIFLMVSQWFLANDGSVRRGREILSAALKAHKEVK